MRSSPETSSTALPPEERMVVRLQSGRSWSPGSPATVTPTSAFTWNSPLERARSGTESTAAVSATRVCLSPGALTEFVLLSVHLLGSREADTFTPVPFNHHRLIVKFPRNGIETAFTPAGQDVLACLPGANAHEINTRITVSLKKDAEVKRKAEAKAPAGEEATGEDKPVGVGNLTIIFPYAGNVDLTNQLLDSDEFAGLAAISPAATVDSFKGHEGDIVVLVMGTRAESGPGFTARVRRLNVMLTR